jgi:hypothetical protein
MEALLIKSGDKYSVPSDFTSLEETFPLFLRNDIGAVVKAQYVSFVLRRVEILTMYRGLLETAFLWSWMLKLRRAQLSTK